MPMFNSAQLARQAFMHEVCTLCPQPALHHSVSVSVGASTLGELVLKASVLEGVDALIGS